MDSLYKTAFPKNKEKDYSHVVKSYAAVLFNMLSKYQYYLIRLNDPKGNISSSFDKAKTGNNFVGGKFTRNNPYLHGKNKKGKCR